MYFVVAVSFRVERNLKLFGHFISYISVAATGISIFRHRVEVGLRVGMFTLSSIDVDRLAVSELFLAHLNRRFTGELGLRRPYVGMCVCMSIFYTCCWQFRKS